MSLLRHECHSESPVLAIPFILRDSASCLLSWHCVITWQARSYRSSVLHLADAAAWPKLDSDSSQLPRVSAHTDTTTCCQLASSIWLESILASALFACACSWDGASTAQSLCSLDWCDSTSDATAWQTAQSSCSLLHDNMCTKYYVETSHTYRLQRPLALSIDSVLSWLHEPLAYPTWLIKPLVYSQPVPLCTATLLCSWSVMAFAILTDSLASVPSTRVETALGSYSPCTRQNRFIQALQCTLFKGGMPITSSLALPYPMCTSGVHPIQPSHQECQNHCMSLLWHACHSEGFVLAIPLPLRDSCELCQVWPEALRRLCNQFSYSLAVPRASCLLSWHCVATWRERSDYRSLVQHLADASAWPKLDSDSSQFVYILARADTTPCCQLPSRSILAFVMSACACTWDRAWGDSTSDATAWQNAQSSCSLLYDQYILAYRLQRPLALLIASS